jgi:hypothetical protein
VLSAAGRRGSRRKRAADLYRSCLDEKIGNCRDQVRSPRDASASHRRRKSVERAGIVDEDALPRRGVGHPFGQDIDEVAVVRHLTAVEIDVRPVGSEHEALRRVADEGAGERRHGGIGDVLQAAAHRPRQLHPHPPGVEHAQQRLECRLFGAARRRDAGEVVEHDRIGQRQKAGCSFQRKWQP